MIQCAYCRSGRMPVQWSAKHCSWRHVSQSSGRPYTCPCYTPRDSSGRVIEDAEECESCGRSIDVSEIDWRYEDAYICKLCSAQLAREQGGAGS